MANTTPAFILVCNSALQTSANTWLPDNTVAPVTANLPTQTKITNANLAMNVTDRLDSAQVSRVQQPLSHNRLGCGGRLPAGCVRQNVARRWPTPWGGVAGPPVVLCQRGGQCVTVRLVIECSCQFIMVGPFVLSWQQ